MGVPPANAARSLPGLCDLESNSTTVRDGFPTDQAYTSTSVVWIASRTATSSEQRHPPRDPGYSSGSGTALVPRSLAHAAKSSARRSVAAASDW